MDERSLWGWLVRGLAGIVNIIEKLAAEGSRPSEHFKGELEKELLRLTEIVEKLETH